MVRYLLKAFFQRAYEETILQIKADLILASIMHCVHIQLIIFCFIFKTYQFTSLLSVVSPICALSYIWLKVCLKSPFLSRFLSCSIFIQKAGSKWFPFLLSLCNCLTASGFVTHNLGGIIPLHLAQSGWRLCDNSQEQTSRQKRRLQSNCIDKGRRGTDIDDDDDDRELLLHVEEQ